MSDAGDEIQVDAPVVEVEAKEAPKGKLSVEDALQVLYSCTDPMNVMANSFG